MARFCDRVMHLCFIKISRELMEYFLEDWLFEKRHTNNKCMWYMIASVTSDIFK